MKTTTLCEACNREIDDHNWSAHVQSKTHQQLEKEILSAKRGVFISNLMGRIDQYQLHEYFLQFGNIRNIQVHKHKQSAIVAFTEEKGVYKALSWKDHVIGRQFFRVAALRPMNKVRRDKVDRKAARSQSQMDQLQAVLTKDKNVEGQMVALMNEWRIPDKRRNLITDTVAQIQSALQNYLPGCFLRPFGSAVNGLGTSDCDLDVVLQDPHSEGNVRERDMCSSTLTALKSSPISRFINDYNCISAARVPLLKFYHWGAKLEVDMTFGAKLSVHNTRLIQLLVELDDRVPVLMYTLRYWTKRAGFSDHTQRVTSYALFMLLYFYLQSTKPRVLPTVEQLAHMAASEPELLVEGWDCRFSFDKQKIKTALLQDTNTQSLAELLQGFFTFYAKLDLTFTVICVRTGLSFTMPEFSKVMRVSSSLEGFKLARCLYVQDPFQLNRNIMGNLNYKYADHFVMSIEEAAHRIDQCPEDWDLNTFIPKKPVDVDDSVMVPGLSNMTVVLRHHFDLMEEFSDCKDGEETKVRWFQSVVDELKKWLPIWRVSYTEEEVGSGSDTGDASATGDASVTGDESTTGDASATEDASVTGDESTTGDASATEDASVCELKRKRTDDVDGCKKQKTIDPTELSPDLNDPVSMETESPRGSTHQLATSSQAPAASSCYTLRRITRQRKNLHCRASHKIWEVKKDLPANLKHQLLQVPSLEREAQTTEQMFETDGQVPSLETPLEFDLCFSRLDFGCMTVTEITLESETPKADIEHFRSFICGYGAKIMKLALNHYIK